MWALWRNCAHVLGCCQVQNSYSVPHSVLGSASICLSSNRKLLFISEDQQPFQPPSHTNVAKKEGRSESLVRWLKHMRLRLIVCWKSISSSLPASCSGPPRVFPNSFRTSQFPSSCRSPVLSCEWSAVVFFCPSALATGHQMACWENPVCFADKASGEPSCLCVCWWQRSQRTRSTCTMYLAILLCLCLHTELYLPWARTHHADPCWSDVLKAWSKPENSAAWLHGKAWTLLYYARICVLLLAWLI